MKEENIIKLSRFAGGLFLVGLYAFTAADGVILALAAFLLGMPAEYFLEKKKT